jgi:subtilisin family serine protease
VYALMLLVLLFPASAWAGPVQQPPEPAPVDRAVQEQLQAQGSASFWVVLEAQADLSGAENIAGWAARGQYVVDRLQAVADQTQSGVISIVQKAGAAYKPYWIVNAIWVNGDNALVNELRTLPEVARIAATQTLTLPEPAPGQEEDRIEAVEWNVARINAPQVWSTYGVTGQGIVVANIDTGVQYDHPALVGKYRGNLGGGVFDHNYNWFDPSRVCGNPSLVPCDNNGHGTHTMGTMVGDDGGANQIGVAPGARFIMAKGCESNSCSDTALLASAQWVLAPTDLNGANPRPDLRPHIVNNSWGGGGGDFWYQAMVQAWVAAGIFPAFSIGNSGPSCGTAGSPGDYVESYGAGGFDINNNVYTSSSRGPAVGTGIIKPNISAPAVSVRSSVPVGSYASYTGTSMASPHVAATVALIWSAAPALTGDIAQTRAILDQTAIDTSDLSCGGTAENNNVWGQGKLDAFAAVSQSPIGQVGALQGTVTDAATLLPLAGATVQAVGPITRFTTTDINGFYSFPILSTGNYAVTVNKFAYLSQTADVTINESATTVQNFALIAAPSYSLSGYVRDQYLQPIANATVTILGTPIPPAITDAMGYYFFPSVPAGTYNVSAAAGRCNNAQTLPLVLSGNVTDFNFALPLRTDAFGYFCQVQPPAYIEANTILPLTGDDSYLQISLPFNFSLYGSSYGSAFVCTNGYMNFLAGNCLFSNSAIPSTAAPNGAIYPFWDDLYVDASVSSVRTELLSNPNRFVIEWRNVRPFGDTTRRFDFEVVLYEGGQILIQYRNIANDGREKGNSATLGIENETGTVAFQYSYNEAVIADPEFAVMYRLPPSAFVEGYVTDFNDGLPIAGATVKALQNGSPVRQVTTGADGFYRFQIPLGTYAIEASKTNYQTEIVTLDLATEDATYVQNFVLKTPRGEISPNALEFLVPLGQSRTKTLTLSNTGSLPMTYAFNELGGGQVMASAAPNRAQAMLEGGFDPNARTTKGLTAEAQPMLLAQSAIQAPGDILKSWAPTGMTLAWGVGYDGRVWLSDPASAPILRGKAFDVNGNPLGPSYDCPWGGSWCGDMAYDAGRGWMCSVNVGGDNGIYCWNPATGANTGSITGAFPWTSISQRGLAYRPDDDTFYIGGWNQDILYHIAGFSHATPGAVLDQCNAPAGISGLAWNPVYNVIWEATNSPTDTIYQISPACTVLGSLAHPNPGYNGAGLEMDEAGNLWMISQDPNRVYLIDSGLPSFTDVPWLSESPSSGILPAGGSQVIQVTANTIGLTPGVYEAMLVIQTNSGRNPNLSVPVRLIVPAYYVGVNAGGGQYVDKLGETWFADRSYTAGNWGYTNKKAPVLSTKKPIAGTDDDPLFQVARTDPIEYRFDGLVPGVYQIELRFAELQSRNAGTRIFDVIAELNNFLLPAYDIVYSVGNFTADTYVFYLVINDGQLNLRFVQRRGYASPIINAIRIIHRPDMAP